MRRHRAGGRGCSAIQGPGPEWAGLIAPGRHQRGRRGRRGVARSLPRSRSWGWRNRGGCRMLAPSLRSRAPQHSRRRPEQRQRGRLPPMEPGPAGPPGRGLRRRRRLLLAAGLSCTALTLYTCLQELPPLDVGPGRTRPPPEVTVLLWWEPFGHRRHMGDCQRRFNISGCQPSANRSRYWEAQAVILHHRDLVLHGLGQLPAGPPPRPPAQRWVWMNFESPSHSPGLKDLAGIFNWTMSYRVDSDIFVPYGYLRARQASPRFSLPRKTKLVAWVISNWNEAHARVRYYHQLRKYVPIDVYGAQGLVLEKGSMVRIISQYKFYLAFENSQHPDYITEKLWRNAFKSSAVPIVLGPPRSNYELFIPSNSFIHINDFPSPKKLAIYLKFLDQNKTLYRRYFAWRDKYNVHMTSFWDEQYCKVCEAVRTAGDQLKIIQNLASWFES